MENPAGARNTSRVTPANVVTPVRGQQMPAADCFIRVPRPGYTEPVCAKLAAVFHRLVVGRFAADDAVADQLHAVCPAVVLPGTHPFAIAPAIRAEQGGDLAGKRALDRVKHGRKLGLLEFLRAHCRAAESDGVEESELGGIRLLGGEKLRLRARCLHAFENRIRHGLRIARAAPEYNRCLFHITLFLSD